MILNARAAIAFACMTLSCGTTDRAVGETFTVVDSARVKIITNHSLSSREGAWMLDSTAITTVGKNSLDSNQQFRRLPLAVRLSNGSVIVTENGVISAFDSAGAYLKTIARRGRGPGELENVSRMLVLPGDTLIVRGSGKIMKYASEGGGILLSEERYTCPSAPRLWHGSAWCRSEFFADGSALRIARDSTIPVTATNRPDRLLSNGLTSPGPGHLRQLYRVFIIPPARDTAYATGLSTGTEQYGIAVGPDQNEFIMHLFYSVSYTASGGSPRRLATVLNPDYNVEVWNDRGILTSMVRRTNARRVPSDAEHAVARKYIELQLDGSPVTVDRALAEMTVPDTLPAIVGLLVGAGGELLVQTRGWRTSDSTSVFDVFDDRGVWVAEWKLPRRARALEMGPDYILTVRMDEDDIPLVEVRRFRREAQGRF